MKDATHFVEVFKSKDRQRLIHSPEPQPIKHLAKNLREFQQSSELKLIAVWYIKPKPGILITGETINDQSVLIVEPIK